MQLLLRAACTFVLLFFLGTASAADAPQLVSPAAGATLPNGGLGKTLEHVWDFEWKGVLRATAYELWVKSEQAKFPLIKVQVKDVKFRNTSKGYTAQLKGWKWKVRALVGGKWGPWSTEREFRVAPPVPLTQAR